MTGEVLLLILFVSNAAALLHTYVIYPFTLYVLTLLFSNYSENKTNKTPSVALIIAAYNEEDIISQKIENSLELEYPDDQLNIIVFSDASDDNTDELVESYEDQGISLVRVEGRVGKTECQNHVAQLVDEEIMVFSDANSMYEPNAVTELVRSFTPEVDCVVGELRYRDGGSVQGESMYWRYESWIKSMESQFNSLITGNGSIYAVRSKSYVPQPADAISDFTEPLSILRNRRKVRYAPKAVAWEDTETSADDELNRRIRIVTRSWNSIVKYLDLLNPLSRPLIAYQLWSHKILRWLSPVFLTVVGLANIALVGLSYSLIYIIPLMGQAVFYVLAIIGYLCDGRGEQNQIITHVPFYFIQSNYGMIIGLFKFIQGENIVVWDTTQR